MLFEKRVNVQEGLNRIARIVREADHKRAIYSLEEAKRISHEIAVYVKWFIYKFHKSTHPRRLNLLKDIYSLLKEFKSIKTLEGLSEYYKRLYALLEECFNVGSVYLLRHPEREKPDVSSVASLMGEHRRALTHEGVEQAKRFAEQLSSEILLCPKTVQINIFFSEMKRTELLGKIIEYKLHQIASHFNKNVRLGSFTRDPRLYFRFNREHIKELQDYKEGFRKNSWESFLDWVEGKALKDWPNARAIAKEIHWFLEEYRKYVEDCRREWKVVVGISHSWIIDSYLYHVTGEHKGMIESADFLKIELEQLYYKGKWHSKY